MATNAVPTIDDEITDAVRELALAFNCVDEDTLSFVPLDGAAIGDESECLDAVSEASQSAACSKNYRPM